MKQTLKLMAVALMCLGLLLPEPSQAMGLFGGYPVGSFYGGYRPYNPPTAVSVNVRVRFASPYGGYGGYGYGYGSHGPVGPGGYGYGYGYGFRPQWWGGRSCGRNWWAGQRCGFARKCCRRRKQKSFSLFIGIGGFRLGIGINRWSF